MMFFSARSLKSRKNSGEIKFLVLTGKSVGPEGLHSSLKREIDRPLTYFS